MTEQLATREFKLPKTLRFMQKLWELSHALQSLSKRMESSIGVTGAQRLAVRLVGRSPGITAGDLAATMRIHPSTLTGILRRLEEQKAVRRELDREDGRRARLHLTDHGNELDRDRSPTVEAAVQRALKRLSAERVDVAREVIEILIEELEREAAACD